MQFINLHFYRNCNPLSIFLEDFGEFVQSFFSKHLWTTVCVTWTIIWSKNILGTISFIQKSVSLHSVALDARARKALKQSTSKSSQQRFYIERAVLKKFAIFTGKHLTWSLVVIKLQALKTCNFMKKILQHRFFPVNIAKILRTPVLKNICRANQLTGFYMMGTLFVEGLKVINLWDIAKVGIRLGLKSMTSLIRITIYHLRCKKNRELS